MYAIRSYYGQPTLARQHEMAVEAERQTAMADPVVARILSIFPGAEVLSIEKEDV